jgi:hypothetical protein
MSLPSHADNGTVESCWQWRCRGDVSHGMMSLPNHAGYGVAKATLAVVLPTTMLTCHLV